MLIGHAKTSKNIGVFNMGNDKINVSFFCLVLGAIIGAAIGVVVTTNALHKQALEANVAQYDPQTGDFKYKIMDEKSGM